MPPGTPALELALLEMSKASVFPLPATGEVTIGRAAECDICIEDRSVSRRHALLRLGPTLTVEDLGSANGTFVGENDRSGGAGTTQPGMMPLAPGRPTALVVGALLRVGSKLLVLRPASRAGVPVTAVGKGRPSGVVPVVEDQGMRALYAMAERVARSPLSVLILGETGVGKEVLAETIHRRSERAAAPFLRLNCAALSESLLESELFGHEAGAFTGAARAKPGLLETAAGGTVFLDEVGEIPLGFQVKLLRVLEDRRVTRVGGLRPIQIDMRFLAATNRDLEAEIRRGTFRQDLYFRLNGVSLTVPPLRERRSEIADLARLFAARTSEQLGRPRPPRIPEAVLARLERYAWPGNIRELRNVIERAVVLCAGDALAEEHLPAAIAGAAPTGRAPQAETLSPPPATPASASTPAPLRDEIEALERQRILDTLQKCGGNQTEAARLLGMSRRTMVSRLGDYGIPRPRKR